MAYDYTQRQIESDTWDYQARAAAWRLKAEHAEQETKHWKRVAAALRARLAVAEAASDD